MDDYFFCKSIISVRWKNTLLQLVIEHPVSGKGKPARIEYGPRHHRMRIVKGKGHVVARDQRFDKF